MADMTFKEFCRNRRRLCDEFVRCTQECPLYKHKKSKLLYCLDACMMYPEEVEVIVQKWAQQHPENQIEEKVKEPPKSYEQGLEDAWELAIKIWCHMEPEDLYKLFHTDEADEVMNGFTVREVMKRLQEWGGRIMRIYISGPITGTDDYMERFLETEEKLIAEGYTVYNPANANLYMPEGTTHREYMKISFTLLDMAGAIYMMRGWEKSRGANQEYGYALAKGYTIIEE